MVIQKPKLWAALSVLAFVGGIQAGQKIEDPNSWDYIRNRVSKTIKRKVREENLRPLEIKAWGKHHPDEEIYMLPHLPFYALYFNERDFFQVSVSVDWASQAYSSNGDTQNLSRLVFGEKNIELQDILLTSKLARAGKLLAAAPLKGTKNDANAVNETGLVEKFHFLSILADQKICFNASFYELVASLHYAHHFYNDHVTLGIHAPIKMRKQRLRLNNEIDMSKRQDLQDIQHGTSLGSIFQGCTNKAAELEMAKDLHFYRKYKCLKDFLEDILCKKCIDYNERETTTGFGDVTLYANVDMHASNASRFVLGASVQIPTTGDRDIKKLWGPELGNGGFVDLSLFGSAVYQVNRAFNPYAVIKGSYLFKNEVSRRVPQNKQHAADKRLGMAARSTKNLLVCGDGFFVGPETDPTTDLTKKFAFCEPDTTVRRFADKTAKIEIEPGQSLFFRLGNTFDSAFWCRGFFDIHYDLFLKGKDDIKDGTLCGIPADTCSTSNACDAANKCSGNIITDNTWQVAHTIGADYIYQCNKHYRATFGGSWVFAGRNAERRYGLHFTINGEF